MVWPIISGVVAFGAFKSGVGKVYHADVHSGVIGAMCCGAVCFLEVPLEVIIQRCCVLLVLQSIINDEK